MARWRVSTLEKKSVQEHEVWVKQGEEERKPLPSFAEWVKEKKSRTKAVEVVRVSVFYSGQWIVETDGEDPPNLESTDEDPLDMNDNGYETDLVELNDGWFEWKFPAKMSKSEREQLVAGFAQDGPDYMYENGWANHVSHCFVLGEVEVELLDD